MGKVAGLIWVGGAVCRLGEQDRGEYAFGIAAMRCAGEEVLDLVEQPVDVSASGEPQSVVPGLLEIAGAGPLPSARSWGSGYLCTTAGAVNVRI
jgi:hypothetical protein